MDRPPTLFEVPEGSGMEEAWEEPRLDERFDFQSLATAEGAEFKMLALKHVLQAGGMIARLNFEVEGFPVDAEVRSQSGQSFLLLARGTPDPKERSGFRRTDTVQKAGFVAMNLAQVSDVPILMVTSDLPEPDSKPGLYLRSLANVVWDCVATRGDLGGFRRLRTYMGEQLRPTRLRAPWREVSPSAGAEGQLELPLRSERTLRSVDG